MTPIAMRGAPPEAGCGAAITGETDASTAIKAPKRIANARKTDHMKDDNHNDGKDLVARTLSRQAPITKERRLCRAAPRGACTIWGAVTNVNKYSLVFERWNTHRPSPHKRKGPDSHKESQGPSASVRACSRRDAYLAITRTISSTLFE